MNYKALTLGAALGFVLALSHACGGGGEKCDAASCPTGCCDSAGECITRTTEVQCGTSAQACGVCATGWSCVAGVCTPPPGGGTDGGCGPSTNPNGCCSSLGVEQPGTAITSCGSGGGLCQDCTLYGYSCFDPDGTGPQLRSCRLSDGGTPGGGIGSACTSASQCTSVPVTNTANRICKTQSTFGNLTYPEGYCTRRCYADSHCGASGLCIYGIGVFGEGDNICLQRCASDAECRSGYGCVNFGTTADPLRACWVIPPDGGTVYEIVDAGPGANAGVMGGPCAADTQCEPPADGFCIPEAFDGGATGYTGGSCTAECTYGGDPYCGTGGVCVLYLFVSTNSELGQIAGLCEAACAPSSTTCRTGYYCASLSASAGYCSPRCDVVGVGCPQGYTCNTTTGMCCNASECF
jgi:hypothetical protein